MYNVMFMAVYVKQPNQNRKSKMFMIEPLFKVIFYSQQKNVFYLHPNIYSVLYQFRSGFILHSVCNNILKI